MIRHLGHVGQGRAEIQPLSLPKRSRLVVPVEFCRRDPTFELGNAVARHSLAATCKCTVCGRLKLYRLVEAAISPLQSSSERNGRP